MRLSNALQSIRLCAVAAPTISQMETESVNQNRVGGDMQSIRNATLAPGRV